MVEVATVDPNDIFWVLWVADDVLKKAKVHYT